MSFRNRKLRVVLALAVITVGLWLYQLEPSGPPFVPDSESDHAVVLVALEHFAQQDESSCTLDKTAQTIYLDPVISRRGTARARVPFGAWSSGSQLADSLQKRNGKGKPHDWPSTVRVPIVAGHWGHAPEGEQLPDFRCKVSVSFPGYSRNGQLALVEISFGPTPHGAKATYLLRQDGDAWFVVTFETRWYA